MTRFATVFALVLTLLVFTGVLAAQTTTLSVTVPPEASLTINTSTTTLATAGTNFTVPYTGTTDLSFQVRTTKGTGSSTIALKVTTDFSPASGPSVASPPTSTDALTYTNTLTTGTAAAGQTASMASSTNVGTFAAGVGTSGTGTVNWSLTDDPKYIVGTYTATVTFTISVT
jgi:hypothetical protein